ncbi:MAG: DegT/DnrJ/EryC1/StrS family aminotransferase [bacterium]
MAVHYGGHPCDMGRIMELAEKYGLKVIEDAAHGCGSEYKGKKPGSIGDIGCFSFHAIKNVAMGKGGMLALRDEGLYETLKKHRWLGIDRDTWARTGPEEGRVFVGVRCGLCQRQLHPERPRRRAGNRPARKARKNERPARGDRRKI